MDEHAPEHHHTERLTGLPQNGESPTAAASSTEKLANSGVKHRIDTVHEVSSPRLIEQFRELERLTNLLNDDNVDLEKFCLSIRHMPQLQTRIFRQARSIMAGRGNQIQELKHAVTMLGLQKTKAILAEVAESEIAIRNLTKGQTNEQRIRA